MYSKLHESVLFLNLDIRLIARMLVLCARDIVACHKRVRHFTLRMKRTPSHNLPFDDAGYCPLQIPTSTRVRFVLWLSNMNPST